MFDQQIVMAVSSVAMRYSLDPAALLAITEVQSDGKFFAIVDGRAEPLIKFDWQLFHRRVSPQNRAKAGSLGQSLSVVGGAANPEAQVFGWTLLFQAVKIDAHAAFESASWGVGQIMGIHWQWLGFNSVADLAELCRRDVAGQVELMVRYIDKAELTGDVRARDWASFARGFNGRAYRKQRHHLKLAAAHERWLGMIAATRKPDGEVSASTAAHSRV